MCSWFDSHWMSCMSSWFDLDWLSCMSNWFDTGGLSLVCRLILTESVDVRNILIGIALLDMLIVHIHEKCGTVVVQ